MLKRKCLVLGMSLMLASALYGCEQVDVPTISSVQSAQSVSSDAAAVIGDIPTVQSFSEEAVSSDDISRFVTAGINAPSAMNKQPWHFTVVTNKEVLQQIASDMSVGRPAGAPAGKPDDGDKKDKAPAPAPTGTGPKAGIADAPVAIVISCKEGSEFDAGLACESMSDMANVMGYGTKIVSSPTIALNGEKKDEYKSILNIPDDQSAVAVLLVGHPADSIDTSSGATERNTYDDVVSLVD